MKKPPEEKCQSLTDENELSQKAKLLKNMTGLQSEILLEVLSDSTIRLTVIRLALSCYQQKENHGEFFGEATKISTKPKREMTEGLYQNCPEKFINVEKLKSYPEFLINNISLLPCYIWISYQKSLTMIDELKISGFRICNYQNMQGELSINEWDIIIVNVIMRQMSSGTNVRKSENAMRDLLRLVQHVLAMDALMKGKRVEFVSTGAVMARALMERASKLIKQDNSPIKSHYTNTVEAGISFADHFDIVIAIANIATPVHVEALAQMLYRIRDFPHHIVLFPRSTKKFK
ncbi:hypothetical protein Glove_374g55 [Diversispora epigaea]|uniref:Uncharacterized protein n=1 Tax=Diversispora epigaea TaxID=1348612 RepID=A0A397H9M3_9GLOM|nr:hypothetical protein Glove_374g55 [Diversispora epigaea]